MVGSNQKLVVVSQHGTSWSLVKGTQEKGEDELTTLRREVQEETGIADFSVIKELGTYDRYTIGPNGGEDKTALKTITFYLCSTSQQELTPQDPDNPEALWVAPDKVAELLTHPKDKRFYLEHLAEVKDFISQR